MSSDGGLTECGKVIFIYLKFTTSDDYAVFLRFVHFGKTYIYI